MASPIVNLALSAANFYLANRAHQKLKSGVADSDKKLYKVCRTVGIVGGVVSIISAIGGCLENTPE